MLFNIKYFYNLKCYKVNRNNNKNLILLILKSAGLVSLGFPATLQICFPLKMIIAVKLLAIHRITRACFLFICKTVCEI